MAETAPTELLLLSGQVSKMIFAQLKNNIIENVILLNSEEDAEAFLGSYDAIQRIDNVDPVPQIGYIFNGEAYSAPEISIDEQIEIKKAELLDSSDDGSKAFSKFLAQKVVDGFGSKDIGQIGIQLQYVTIHMLSGNKYAALTSLSQLESSSQLSDEDILNYGNTIRGSIGLPASDSKDGLAVF